MDFWMDLTAHFLRPSQSSFFNFKKADFSFTLIWLMYKIGWRDYFSKKLWCYICGWEKKVGVSQLSWKGRLVASGRQRWWRFDHYNLGQKCYEKWTLPCPVSRKRYWKHLKQLKILLPPQSNVDVRLDHLSPWLNNIDQGGAKGGAIVEPNQRDRLSVGKKVQNVLTLFVQGCNISSHEGLALKT